MRLYIAVFCLTFTLFSSQAASQIAEVIKLDNLKQMLSPESDTIYVINFWATWCKPCVKEMPYFEKLGANFADKKLKVILISLDFTKHLETQLIPYLKKNKIQSRVMLLDEPDANRWIDLVDPSWSGAIPATLVIHASTNHRSFYEKEFTYVELENIVKPLITD